MFIIWGTGKRTTRKYGVVLSALCGRCGNNVQREIIKVTTWFTLFFIPIIPYRTEYYLMCPICKGAREISKAEFNEVVNDPNKTHFKSDTASDDVKYAGKTSTQIEFLKHMEQVENEQKDRG